MDCRGEDTRRQIVEEYNVVPVAYIQLLAGQIKHSDAGGNIKNDYYIFNAVHKTNGNREVIQCGMRAARDFLRLLNHGGLPIFNPLHEEGGDDPQGGAGIGRHNGGDPQSREDRGRRNSAWNLVARQLYNAIMWVIIIIKASPNTPIFDIRQRVYNFRDREPFESQVKGVNKIISRTMQGKTLTEAINELRAKNNIRDELCQFDILVDIIHNATDEEGKPLKSYF